MKKLMNLCLLLFIGMNLIAQEIEIPENIKLEKEEDYKANEELVLESIEWIHKTPLTQNTDKRKEINAFLIQWMSGSPTVSIALVSGLVPMDCSECLMSFMSGWTKYSLENNYSNDNIKCALAGIERMMAFYEKNKSELGKNADIKKMIKLKKKDKLEKYIESKL